MSDVRPLADKGDVEIFNAVRSATSPQFQVRIPAATQGNIRNAVDTMRNFPYLRDEFTGVLIQRLIGLYVQHADWDDPLKLIGSPRTLKRYGSTYEQAAVGLVKARTRNFDKEYLGDDVYGRYSLPTASVFHPLTFDHYYPVTIPEDALLTAFDGESGMSNYIAEIMNAPILSDRNDMYTMKVECFAEYARKGGFYRVHTPDVGKADSTEADAKTLLRLIQQVANELKSMPMSAMGRYNAMSWVTPWRDSEAILFATPAVIAALNVEALAAAFNIDRANVPYRIIPIPEDMFGIGGAAGKVQAVLTTEDFFFQWDEMLETTNSPVNPIDGTRNIFYKHRGSITPNPFANAVLFWTGEGSSDKVVLPDTLTASTPKFELLLKKYGQSAVTPQNVSRGDLVQVVSTISSTNKDAASFQPIGITYAVEGAISQFTSIDNDGILRCGLDETAETLKVTAQATYIDPAHPEVDQTVSAALAVPVVGDWMGGWKPGAIDSIEIQGKKTVKQNESTALKAIVTKTDGSKADVTNLSIWNIADGGGRVTPNGVYAAVGVAPGTATISVTFAGVTATTKVNVTD
nr:MAG TPA: Head protein [Caudoviricetes sp.]